MSEHRFIPGDLAIDTVTEEIGRVVYSERDGWVEMEEVGRCSTRDDGTRFAWRISLTIYHDHRRRFRTPRQHLEPLTPIDFDLLVATPSDWQLVLRQTEGGAPE